jgi:hypothetical protein
MKSLSAYIGDEDGPLLVEGGLAYAIAFAEALGPQLQGRDVSVTISGIRQGLFFHDEIRGRAIRVSVNRTAGCGRMYAGKSSDFEYDTKHPAETLVPFDWDDDEISLAIQKAVSFFVHGSQ